MGYYLDLEKITIEEYMLKLSSSYLPPSRLVLKKDIEIRFGFFIKIGLKNVRELLNMLNKKDKLEELSNLECFKDDYLTILLRELKSTLPKPNKLADFTWISKNVIDALTSLGISNTEKLYYAVLTKADRLKLAKLVDIENTDILALTKLADLSRIKWVGVTYAQMLYTLGFDTVEKISKSDPVDLHLKINKYIKDFNIFKGGIGINDVKILVETANDLPFDVEY